MSPLQNPARTPTHNTKPHVNSHLLSPKPLQPAKFRSANGRVLGWRFPPMTPPTRRQGKEPATDGHVDPSMATAGDLQIRPRAHPVRLSLAALRVSGWSRCCEGPRLNARDPPESALTGDRITGGSLWSATLRACVSCWWDWAMWRCSVSTASGVRRWGCTSVGGCETGLWGLWRAGVVQRGAAGGVGGPAGVWAGGAARARSARRDGHRAGFWGRAAAGEADDARWPLGDAPGRLGRPLGEVADELGCSWHPVNESVRRWGEALLDADTQRIAVTEALGLDEHLMGRRGRFRTKSWATSVVDVGRGQLLDIVPARIAKRRCGGCSGGPAAGSPGSAGRCWTSRARTGPRSTKRCRTPHRSRTRSMSCGWATTPSTTSAAESRTRHWGNRGHKHDPLYRARKLLASASERITDSGRVRLRGLLSTQATPTARSATPGTPKKPCAASMTSTTPRWGAATVEQLACDLQDPGLPPEINRHSRTLRTWRTQIANRHTAKVTNAATEAANNPVKRVKRAAFGLPDFANYRISPALCRQTQLDPPRHPHSTLKRGEPH